MADGIGYFTAEHIEIAQEVANQLALAIHQSRLNEQNRRQATELESLRQVTLDISTQLDIDQLLQHLVESAVKLLGVETGGMYLLDPEKNVLRRMVSVGPEWIPLGSELQRGEGLSGKVWETGEPLVIADYLAYGNHAAQYEESIRRHGGVKAMIGVPVMWGDGLLGVINASVSEGAARTFAEPDVHLLSLFADQAAVAIQNARLYRELEAHSQILELAVEERTAELRVQKEQAEAVLQSASDAMILTDPQGLILTINRAFASHTGYEADEIVGQHIGLVTAELADSPTLKSLINAVRTQQSWRMETRIRRKDGTQFDADVGMAPLNEEGGGLRGWVTSIRDISAFKEVERLKDEFLSTAAHELRTPLTSIQGFSEILMTRDLDETRRKNYLRTINEQSTQLAQIIDDLLDISRLQAGRTLEIKHEPVDMGSLVAEMVQPFITTSPRHHFEFDSLLGSPAVLGDRFRLGQVVRNLLSNAVKYSPAGGAITIRGKLVPGYFEVSVQDEGIGMTPEQQAHLFERFYRADPGSSAIGGTGLGLTICKLIVEEHGGRMWAESEAGVGSKFIFTVPLLEGNATTGEQLP